MPASYGWGWDRRLSDPHACTLLSAMLCFFSNEKKLIWTKRSTERYAVALRTFRQSCRQNNGQVWVVSNVGGAMTPHLFPRGMRVIAAGYKVVLDGVWGSLLWLKVVSDEVVKPWEESVSTDTSTKMPSHKTKMPQEWTSYNLHNQVAPNIWPQLFRSESVGHLHVEISRDMVIRTKTIYSIQLNKEFSFKFPEFE